MKDQETPITPSQCRTGRSILGWTVADLAEASGVSEPTIHRFEKDKPIKVGTIALLRQAFADHHVRFVTEGTWAGVVTRVRAG